MASEYSDKLKDPRWQRLRLEALNASDWKCSRCGSTTRVLDVHHLAYVDGREPWEYPLEELRVLCKPCHKLEHGLPPSPDQTVKERKAQEVRDLEARIVARANELKRQQAGTAPRSPLEEEIASVQEQIPLAEKSGDKAWLDGLLLRAIELNRRRLGMVA